MNIVGIYKIISIIKPERVYVGSAINILIRWERHLKKLKYDSHGNIKIQRHHNKYGVEDLKFFIIEEFEFISKEHLLGREQYWIDTIKPWFNICKKAGSLLGCHWELSEKTKQKMRKPKSEETKQRMKIAQSKKGLVSEESKQKMRVAKLGKKRSPHLEKTKCLMSESKIGNKNPSWSGKYEYLENLTKNQRQVYRAKIRRQLSRKLKEVA